MQFLEFDLSVVIKKIPNLLKLLPNYYQTSEVTKNVLDAHAYEIGLLDLQIEDIKAQLNIETATWGLVYYERNYGIKPDPNDTIQNRRDVVIAKMRGQGTITKTMIKLTAEAFSGGEVEIIEHNDESYFVIKFIGTKGIPTNLNTFKETLDEIIPAHLGYEFEYTYTVWNMVQNQGLIWNDLHPKTWDQLKTY